MNLSWKKYAAAFTTAVCMLISVTETGMAVAADSNGFGWGSSTGGNGFIDDTERNPWVTESNDTQGGWGFQFEEEEDEVSLYVTETPDPTEEELKADHVSGQNGAMFYNIDKKSGGNGDFSFSNCIQDGFKASWSDLESLTIEKGRSFKKPMSDVYFDSLSVDYKVILDNFTGEKFDIGAKCQIGVRGDFLYIFDHFGEFVPDDDMEEFEPYKVNGKTYRIYRKQYDENINGAGVYIHENYYMVCERNIEDLISDPAIVSSVVIKELTERIGVSYNIPPLLSCGFYVDTYGGSGAMEVKYIQINAKSRIGYLGMNPWNTNIWGINDGDDEDTPCILYPDEEGYYSFNPGTRLPEGGNLNILLGGTDMACVNDFGNGDNNSLKVKCSIDYFPVEPSDRFSSYIGDVGEPFRKNTWFNNYQSFDGFSFGPLYPADEDYEESDISYDISVDVYNCSDEEVEFSLEVTMPFSGFGSPEEDQKPKEYTGNIICRKTVKPHEWTTLSNPCYAMPRALTGDIQIITTAEIEYYVDNYYVKEPENVSKVKGDINGDGILDSLDLVKYRKAFFTGGQRRKLPRRADIDGDGNVLMNDVVLLKRFLLGMDKEFIKVENPKTDKIESGEANGCYYESYIKDGAGEIVYDVKENGCFDCSICVSDDALFECGIKPQGGIKLNDISSLYHVYECSVASMDGYLFGIHGTFADSYDEFYIIEDSGHDDRFAGMTYSQMVNIEGYEYRFYVLTKTKYTPEGKVSYNEYWSVLDDYRQYRKCLFDLGGQINILKHIGKWEKYFGAKLADRTLSSIGVCVGGSKQYSPSFSVTRNELFIGRE